MAYLIEVFCCTASSKIVAKKKKLEVKFIGKQCSKYLVTGWVFQGKGSKVGEIEEEEEER